MLTKEQDNSPSQDTWTSPAKPEDVFELLNNWPIGQRLWAVIRHTPRHKFVNYPLINHKPLDHWLSKRNRSILIGDAAHPLSPAAGQGAAQGIEDANVLAVCLGLAGKRNAPLALQVTERIRHSRVSVVQLTSHQANEGWRNQNWDLFDPQQETVASLPLEEWIFDHDSQAYTLAEFHHVATAIAEGKKYLPHNLPYALRGKLETLNFEP
jgi:2-polyprenyl-6-methoxyphenol hydroxylase-like FAD-dependent oxidoreductase